MSQYILQNGLLVDGSGNEPQIADLVIDNGKICQIGVVSPTDFPNAQLIDCTGKVVAPGFIDVHSHMDYFAVEDAVHNFQPFIAQGITTMVVGNCGFSPFGFKPCSEHHDLIENSLFKAAHGSIDWHDFSGYQQRIAQHGSLPNLLSLVGHGVCRTSLNGFNAQPLTEQQRNEMLAMLEDSLKQGAAGVSLGLQYKPGVFASKAELVAVAQLVKKHDKILTVHAKAYSCLSGTYPMVPFAKPHNLKAIEEILQVAKETGVKLQFSHLIFVGNKTWNTLDSALALFDQAIADGVDVKFDTFPYPFGATLLNTVLPEWVMAGMPQILSNKLAMARLKLEAWVGFGLVGLDYGDIQITDACCERYQGYNGQSIARIAEQTGQSSFNTMIDILAESNAEARVLIHKYNNPEIVQKLMQHPASLLMTDSWPEPSGVENAATFGAFPRFLKIVRESNCMSLAHIVKRMTKDAAQRFSLEKRGQLVEGFHADITVFDRQRVSDPSIEQAQAGAAPVGIERVWINGVLAHNQNEGLTAVVDCGEFIKAS